MRLERKVAIIGEGTASTCIEGLGWVGSLSAFEGGKGYWAKVSSAISFEFNVDENIPDQHNIMMSWSQDATAVDKLRLGGGPTNSPLWNQIQADVYGRAVQLLKVEETSVLGAAILGGVGAGVFSSVAEGVDSMVHVMSEIEPDLANHRIYSEMYNAFTQAYEGLDQNTFSILASLQVN